MSLKTGNLGTVPARLAQTKQRFHALWRKPAARVGESAVGYFDNRSREYVVTTAEAPPYTTFGGLAAGNTHSLLRSDGPDFTYIHEDPMDRRLSRYVWGGSEETQNPGAFVYIRDRVTGEFWSASARPVTTTEFDRYEAHLGFGHRRIISGYKGIEVDQLTFEPLPESADEIVPQIQQVVVRNTSNEIKSFTLHTYREFPNGRPEHEAKNPQNYNYVNSAEVHSKDPRIVLSGTGARLNNPEEPEKDRPLIYFSSSERPLDTETSLEVFLGPRGSLENPFRVKKDSVPSRNHSMNEFGIGAHKIEVELAPGKERTLTFILGAAKDKDAAQAAAKKWLDSGPEVIDRSFAAVRAEAEKLLAPFESNLPDADLETMINIWGPYQVFANFLFSRDVGPRASGQSRGMGFRDSNQDIRGFTYMMAQAARQRVIDLISAAHLEDGSALHSFNVRTKKPMEGQGFGDDHLWPVLAVGAYLRETGDMSILDVEIPYVDNPQRSETLYYHLLRCLEFTFTHLGPNGIPLILRADWNDALQRLYKGLYAPGFTPENFKAKLAGSAAESVMIGMQLVMFAKEMLEITERSGRQDARITLADTEMSVTKRLNEIITTMTRNLNENAWDEEGGHYVAGSNDDGVLYGTSSDVRKGEVTPTIFLHPQTWAVMSGVATPERAKRALDSVMARLIYEDGGLLLHYPAYEGGDDPAPLGMLHFYNPYTKENGCFEHAAAMALHAFLQAGRADDAYRILLSNLPPTLHRKDPIKYRSAPNNWPQVLNGKHGEYGAGGDWLTGTAAWNLSAIQEGLIGAKPDYDGLRVDPVLPSQWGSQNILFRRVFRGETYNVLVTNPDGVSTGVRSVIFDGEKLTSNLLPVSEPGQEHYVEVEMG